MHGKEFILSIIRTFFAVVTFICAATVILGHMLAPGQTFGYEAFLSPLLIGVAGTLPLVVMYSRRELSVRELIVRKVIQLILIEALVLFVMFYDSSAFYKNPKIVLSVAASVLIIYVIIELIEVFQDHLNAKKMTEELIAFQRSVDSESIDGEK